MSKFGLFFTLKHSSSETKQWT